MIAVCLVGVKSSQFPGQAAAVCSIIVGLGFVFFVPFAYWILRSRRCWAVLSTVVFGVFTIGFVCMFVESFSRGRPIRLGRMWSYSVQWTTAVAWLGLGLIAIRLMCGKLILHHDIDWLNSDFRNAGYKQTDSGCRWRPSSELTD